MPSKSSAYTISESSSSSTVGRSAMKTLKRESSELWAEEPCRPCRRQKNDRLDKKRSVNPTKCRGKPATHNLSISTSLGTIQYAFSRSLETRRRLDLELTWVLMYNVCESGLSIPLCLRNPTWKGLMVLLSRKYCSASFKKMLSSSFPMMQVIEMGSIPPSDLGIRTTVL